MGEDRFLLSLRLMRCRDSLLHHHGPLCIPTEAVLFRDHHERRWTISGDRRM